MKEVWEISGEKKKKKLRIPTFALKGFQKEERERDWDQKYVWNNYGWKVPKAEEGNRYTGTGHIDGLKHDEHKQIHTRHIINKMVKNYKWRENCKGITVRKKE